MRQDVTRPHWALPGSTANVRVGTFGSQHSFRGDGGTNNGDEGAVGLTHSVWGVGLSPFLRNVGSSRGSFAAVAMGDTDLK